MKFLNATAILASVLLAGLATTTDGCTCMEEPSMKGSIESDNTEAIIKGRVIKQLVAKSTEEVISSSPIGGIDFAEKRYLVKVHNAFKGCDVSKYDFIIVRTGASNNLCGTSMSVGRTYVWSTTNTVKTENIDVSLVPTYLDVSSEMRVNVCQWSSTWSQVAMTDRLQLHGSERAKVCTATKNANAALFAEVDPVQTIFVAPPQFPPDVDPAHVAPPQFPAEINPVSPVQMAPPQFPAEVSEIESVQPVLTTVRPIKPNRSVP